MWESPMIKITNCPICKEENISIKYDYRKMQFILYCNSCDNIFYLLKKVKIECPECEGKDIRFEEDETICRNCGIVLSDTTCYVGGFKIILDWGLNL